VFSPNEHAFTLVDHFDHWMIILESLKALRRTLCDREIDPGPHRRRASRCS